jgi:hypothetical protein
VVHVQVGVLNKDKYPYTTDLFFGTLGYDITFSLEPVDFVPAEAPMEGHNEGSDNGNGTDKKPRNGPDQSQMKKQKTDEGKQNENFTNSNGPVPMQLALMPFPPNVDVANVLAVMKEKAGSTGNALLERKKLQNTYMRRSATPIKKSQDERTKEFPCAKEKTEAAYPSHSTSGGQSASQPTPACSTYIFRWCLDDEAGSRQQFAA